MTNPAQQWQEETRATELLEAQSKAVRLFEEIETRGLIRPGITEKTLNADIYALAKEMYGITTYWHKRIVRAITSSELFQYATSLAKKFGWEFGGRIAGHLVGHFPHEKIADDKVTLYVHPDSDLPMRSCDENGEKRHWILEIHFVDRERQIGGFYEELLTV